MKTVKKGQITLKMKKILSALLASAVAMSLVAGCGGEKKEDAKASDVIKVGVFLPLTGDNAAGGELELRGIKLANKLHPEVLGKKIELVVADNKSDKAEAASVAARLIEKDKVSVIVGSYGSSLSMAAGNIVKDSKVPAVGTSCTNPQVTANNDYYFRACFIDPFQGTVMANFAKNDLQATKAAILIDNSSDYAKGLAAFFKENFIKNGGTVVAEESYLQKDTDFKATLTKIKAAAPDILYVPGYYQEVGMIVKQGREMGIEIPMAGGDGWDSAKLPEIAGKAALNNTYFSSLYSPDDDSALNKAFVSEYEKAYKVKPDVFAALAYDSALLVAEAIKNAGDTDPVKIAQSMAKINGFQGVSGTVTFDAQHNPVKSAVIIEHKDGAQTFRTKINP